MSSKTARRAIASSAIGLLVIVATLVAILHRPDAGEGDEAPLVERERKELELRDGLLYALEEPDNPFDGLLVESYPDGQRKLAIEIVDGRPHGRSRGWFEDGQLEVEESFADGVSHGQRTRWHRNGTVRSRAGIVEGVLQGPFVAWHENGTKATEMTMVDGKPDGECRSWHPSGALKSVAMMRRGTLVNREFFEDHEQPATTGSPVAAAAVEATR